MLVLYYRAVPIPGPSHSLKSRLESNYLWCYITFRNFGIATIFPYQSQQSPKCSRHKVIKFYWIFTTQHYLYQIHVINLESRLTSNYPQCNGTLNFLRAQTIWRRIQTDGLRLTTKIQHINWKQKTEKYGTTAPLKVCFGVRIHLNKSWSFCFLDFLLEYSQNNLLWGKETRREWKMIINC